MSFLARPPYTLLYTWATLLTLLLVHWGQDLSPPTTTSTTTTTTATTPSPLLPLPATPVCLSCLRHVLGHPLTWTDKRLLNHLRNSFESRQPSSSASSTTKASITHTHPPWTNVESFNISENLIRSLFENKHGGVFVEVGAQDGLWLSNTWWLEAEKGWRGLLIEADPYNYIKLRASQRTAKILPACVTTSILTTQEIMVRRNNTVTTDEEIIRHQQGHTKLLKYATESDRYAGHTFTTTCYSIFSVLLAAKITKIDLLLFDVSGGGFDMMEEFLFMNAELGSKFKAKAILYQDNELPQFLSMDAIREELKEFGYSLMKVSMDHYLVYSQEDFAIKVV